jgi:hypothetical protein
MGRMAESDGLLIFDTRLPHGSALQGTRVAADDKVEVCVLHNPSPFWAHWTIRLHFVIGG